MGLYRVAVCLLIFGVAIELSLIQPAVGDKGTTIELSLIQPAVGGTGPQLPDHDCTAENQGETNRTNICRMCTCTTVTAGVYGWDCTDQVCEPLQGSLDCIIESRRAEHYKFRRCCSFCSSWKTTLRYKNGRMDEDRRENKGWKKRNGWRARVGKNGKKKPRGKRDVVEE